MILFDSPVIRLEYIPATDILIADLSNQYEFYALEVRETLQLIVEHVRHYNVTRLLMDSRKRILAMEEAEYASLMTDFMKALQTTRLQRFARLSTGIPAREDLAQVLNAQTIFTFNFRTFPSNDKAIEWLTSNG
jgi:hypothetical protein